MKLKILAPQTKNTSIQDYQLSWDREKRERKSNPRYESQNLTDFTMVFGEAVEHFEFASFEEVVNGSNFEAKVKLIEFVN